MLGALCTVARSCTTENLTANLLLRFLQNAIQLSPPPKLAMSTHDFKSGNILAHCSGVQSSAVQSLKQMSSMTKHRRHRMFDM